MDQGFLDHHKLDCFFGQCHQNSPPHCLGTLVVHFARIPVTYGKHGVVPFVWNIASFCTYCLTLIFILLSLILSGYKFCLEGPLMPSYSTNSVSAPAMCSYIFPSVVSSQQ